MIKRKKIGIVLGALLGGATIGATSAISLVSCTNNKKTNEDNTTDNDTNKPGIDNGNNGNNGNVDNGNDNQNPGNNQGSDGNDNNQTPGTGGGGSNTQNYYLTIDSNKSNSICNILETCIVPKANITNNDLNNSAVKNNIKSNLSTLLSVPSSEIKNIIFIETKTPFYNVSIGFNSNVHINLNYFNDFILSNNTLTTKTPINYGLISMNDNVSQQLYSTIQNYFNSNSNATFESISTGSKYDTFVASIKNVLGNVLSGNRTIENVHFDLSNNNTNVNVEITFNIPVDQNSFNNNYFSIKLNNSKCIQTVRPISVNLFTKIDNSRINLNVDKMTDIFLLTLASFKNNYPDFIELIEQNDNLKKLLIKAQSDITPMNYIDDIVGCNAVLLNNDNASFIIKLTNATLGGNVYVEFNTKLNTTSKVFIFNNDNTKLLGTTSYGKQQNSYDLSPYTNLNELADNAFYDCSNLTSITLPDNITKVGNNVFKNCTNLSKIDLPSLTFLGNNAFENCTSLNNVNLGNSLTNISDNCFVGCSSLSTIVLPDTTKTIGVSAFKNSGLTTINLENVSTLNTESFASCGSLTTITMENSSITNIPNSCFISCGKLNNFNFTNIRSIENNAFSGSGLNNIDLSNITSISDGAFKNCGLLKTITFGNTLNTIPNNCFNNCKSLIAINFWNITTIGNNAFENCGSLKSIDLTNIVNIGTSAFNNCGVLNSVTLGSSIKIIPDNCFKNCISLTNIDLTRVTNIGVSAFLGCKGLNTINFGSSIESISNNCFKGCSKLVSISLPSSLTTIGGEAFYSCTALTSVNFENGFGVTNLGNGAISTDATIYVRSNDLETAKKVFGGYYKVQPISTTNP